MSRVYTGVTERIAILAKRTGGGICKLAKKVKTAWSPEAPERLSAPIKTKIVTRIEFPHTKSSTGAVLFFLVIILMSKVFHAHYPSILIS